MEIKCESCGQIVEVTPDNLCPNCGNRMNNVPKKGFASRIKDLLARFKKVKTVAEWKTEAQDAIKNKEFVIAALTELHRVEKAEAGGQDRQRSGPSPMRNMVQAAQSPSPFASTPSPMASRAPAKSYAESSLKELMDAVRQQQRQQSQQQQKIQ